MFLGLTYSRHHGILNKDGIFTFLTNTVSLLIPELKTGQNHLAEP